MGNCGVGPREFQTPPKSKNTDLSNQRRPSKQAKDKATNEISTNSKSKSSKSSKGLKGAGNDLDGVTIDLVGDYDEDIKTPLSRAVLLSADKSAHSENIAKLHRVFKHSVSKVVASKRMWTVIWNALDKAEETTLLNKFDTKNKILKSVVPEAVGLRRSSITATGPGDQEVKRRQSYVRRVGEMKAEEDVYEEIPGVSFKFLLDLTQIQNQVRQRIEAFPSASKWKDFEIANIPEITETSTITRDWIVSLVREFKNEKILSYASAFHLARRAIVTFLPLRNVVELTIPNDDSIAIVGDIHGQLDDLLMIFREAGWPSEGHRMLFNGDFVDRGKYSCEVLLIMLACRVAYPDAILMNRGNHECADMNSLDGFQSECEAKYDIAMWSFFNHVFAAMPIAHLITVGQQRVFVVHAGLSFQDVTLSGINAEDRFQPVFPMRSILQDLLWSDPFDGVGRLPSKRGAGCQFGSDVTARFLVRNNVNLIIRSHECEDNGFALWFENRLYTIFSASDYCGDSNNFGAFCVLSDAPAPQIRVYMAKKQVLNYGDRQNRWKKCIVSKLLVRIVSKLSEIEAKLLARSKQHGSHHEVSRILWSHTLQECLGIDAPFILISEYIGAKVGSVGSKVDVDDWCARFKPKFSGVELSSDNSLRSQLSDLLFDPASPFIEGLEALFSHFDVNHDGSITYDEFKKGVNSLMKYLGKSYKDEDMEKLLLQVDANGDGEIDYNEFFSAFAYGHINIEEKHE